MSVDAQVIDLGFGPTPLPQNRRPTFAGTLSALAGQGMRTLRGWAWMALDMETEFVPLDPDGEASPFEASAEPDWTDDPSEVDEAAELLADARP